MQWSGYGQPNIDEAGCREAGGLWNPHSGQCEDLARNQCESRGGRWDGAALICRGLPGKAETPAPELCAQRGGEWDYPQRICYSPGGKKIPVTGGSSSAVVQKAAAPVALGVAAAGVLWWLLKR
jgi:hypothetical protein